MRICQTPMPEHLEYARLEQRVHGHVLKVMTLHAVVAGEEVVAEYPVGREFRRRRGNPWFVLADRRIGVEARKAEREERGDRAGHRPGPTV